MVWLWFRDSKDPFLLQENVNGHQYFLLALWSISLSIKIMRQSYTCGGLVYKVDAFSPHCGLWSGLGWCCSAHTVHCLCFLSACCQRWCNDAQWRLITGEKKHWCVLKYSKGRLWIRKCALNHIYLTVIKNHETACLIISRQPNNNFTDGRLSSSQMILVHNK